MWSARFLSHMNHVNVNPTDGNGPTQWQRKTLTRVGIEPTTFGLDLRRSTDWATRSDGSRPWEMKMLKLRQWTWTSTRKGYVYTNVGLKELVYFWKYFQVSRYSAHLHVSRTWQSDLYVHHCTKVWSYWNGCFHISLSFLFYFFLQKMFRWVISFHLKPFN